jgi:HD-GYP domain-containing protein (c-di-GMP phosphodiesterase class II)
MKKPRSLHRRLALSLALVALAVSAALTCLIVHRRSDIIRTAASNDAETRAAMISAYLRHRDLTRSELENLLAAMLPDTASDTGHFIFLGVTDAQGRMLAEVSHNHEASLEEFKAIAGLPAQALRKLRDGELLEWKIIGNRPYLEVSLPVDDPEGPTVRRLEGWFAVSRSEEREAAAALAVAVAASVGTVLLTTLVLYPVILRMLSRLTRLTRRLLESNLEALQVLGSTIAKRDGDTDEHNFRVTLYSVRLAEALKLNDHKIRLLIKGAFLHDVGKIGIRDSILLKPGKLEPTEFEEMKLHVAHGVDIISRSHWMDEAKPVVACHHEKVDGSGYPAGLKGDEIPLLARIFALADVFDALTSERPYKKAFSYEEAIATLRFGSGTHFDQGILEVFLTISHPLFDLFANREDGAARREVEKIIERYYGADMAALLE